jgi:8-oxo-dGTP pyrophosphatase MutT (NUDIX family)
VTAAVAAPPPFDTARLCGVLANRAEPPPDPALARAAVLVPLCEQPRGVLLTRRAAGLRRHPGQVAFPGGRIDPGDASAEAAALREAQEEIGLRAGDVAVLGRLPALVTGTGFHVTPIVCLVAGCPQLRPQPGEVASIFWLPMDVLRDPGSPSKRIAQVLGAAREFWVWPHEQEYIWGATAAILVALAAALAAAEAP